MSDERVLAEADGIYRWDGPKRKQMLLSGTLGRLVLTDRRLLFLSTGSHDVTMGRLAAGASGGGLSTASTDHLDLSALANKGSIDVPLAEIGSARLKGMFKYLSVEHRTSDGRDGASAFAPKNGGMPGGADWVRLIEEARTAT